MDKKNGKKLITLSKSLNYNDVKEYDIYLRELKKEDLSSFNVERIRGEIKTINRNLNSLIGMLTKLRDDYLKEEYNMTFEEAFEEDIEVELPINVDIFFIQHEYYEMLMKLTEIRTKF